MTARHHSPANVGKRSGANTAQVPCPSRGAHDPIISIEETFRRVEERVEDLTTRLMALKNFKTTLVEGQSQAQFDPEDIAWVEEKSRPLECELECWKTFAKKLAVDRDKELKTLTPYERIIQDRFQTLVDVDKTTPVFALFPDLRIRFAAKQNALQEGLERKRVGGYLRWAEVRGAVQARAAEMVLSTEEPGKE